MIIPKKLIKKYEDIYNKDMKDFTDNDWKRYTALLREIRREKEREQEEERKETKTNAKRKKVLST